MPEPTEIMTTLRRIRKELDRFDVASIALFGSTAGGHAREDSDVDLLVDFKGPASFDTYMDLKFFLEEQLGRKVDLVTRKALKPRMKESVEKEAVYVT